MIFYFDPDSFPLDDEKTYELFQKGETVGVFQYESPGMQKHLKDLKPTVFEDLDCNERIVSSWANGIYSKFCT